LTAHGAAAAPNTDIRSAHDILDAEAIRAALERNAFNRLAAARDLGIHKTTLFRRMKKLGIALPEQDGRTGRKPLQPDSGNAV
jgi:transcriptional regulator with GAF, ATPase, and Fis domain